MAENNQPAAPNGLRIAGKALWNDITREYRLSPAELQSLLQACQTADLIARIEKELRQTSLTVMGSYGQVRPNPLLSNLAEHRRILSMHLRDLALPMPDESEGHRRSPDKVAAAQKRWREERTKRSGALE